MDNLKRKLTANPNLTCAVGLKDATAEEIKDLTQWLSARNIRFIHKTHTAWGTKLPFNGAINIGRKL